MCSSCQGRTPRHPRPKQKTGWCSWGEVCMSFGQGGWRCLREIFLLLSSVTTAVSTADSGRRARRLPAHRLLEKCKSDVSRSDMLKILRQTPEADGVGVRTFTHRDHPACSCICVRNTCSNLCRVASPTAVCTATTPIWTRRIRAGVTKCSNKKDHHFECSHHYDGRPLCKGDREVSEYLLGGDIS